MSRFDDNEDYLTGLRMPRYVEDALKGANMADANKQATKVITDEVRLSFVHALEPDSFDGGEPKYSVTVLIPKDNKALLGKIKTAIDAAKEYGKTAKWNGKIPKDLDTPIHDGDDTDYEGYEGMIYIRANSIKKPGIIDRYKQPVTDSNGIYSGCYGRVSINFYPYNAKGHKGVAAGLNNIQVLRDGEPFGGRSSAEHDFDDDFCDQYEDEDPFEGDEGLNDLLGL